MRATYERIDMRGRRHVVRIFALAAVLLPAAVQAKPPKCTISSPQNDPVNVTAGGSAQFQGVVTDGVPTYDVTWTFQGGAPADATDPNLDAG